MRFVHPLGVIAAVAIFIFIPAQAGTHGMSEADRQAMLDAGYMLYGVLGAKHMVTGYDHLLFLFGVMFFLTRFGEIVKFITAFTLGHSITLIFATLLKIQANYFLIDAVIALTVCYKGFDNLDGFRKYLGVKSPNLLVLVFIFGLIHGFGLSARLQTLPLGEGTPFILRLIAFNVGVEAGQVAALSVMLVVLYVWRDTSSFQKFSSAANTGLIIAGGYLFLMQMHGYSHQTAPDDFGFPHDLHSHVHAEMYEASKIDDAPAAVGLEALQDLSVPETASPGSLPEAQSSAQESPVPADNPQRPWSRPDPMSEPQTDNIQQPWTRPGD